MVTTCSVHSKNLHKVVSKEQVLTNIVGVKRSVEYLPSMSPHKQIIFDNLHISRVAKREGTSQ